MLNLKTYPKIKINPQAVILKLADRIANVTFSLATNDGLFRMYEKEYPEFRKSLYDSRASIVPTKWMWQSLDALMKYNEDIGFELYNVLYQIIGDLPTRRDWLDPDLEERARDVGTNFI